MKGDTRCVDGRLMRHDPQFDDPELETDRGQCPECEGRGCDHTDPRDPDPSRPGIFRDHNCYRCKDGTQPCVGGNPRQCEYPHARND